jgi:hypothetical protein
MASVAVLLDPVDRCCGFRVTLAMPAGVRSWIRLGRCTRVIPPSMPRVVLSPNADDRAWLKRAEWQRWARLLVPVHGVPRAPQSSRVGGALHREAGLLNHQGGRT